MKVLSNYSKFCCIALSLFMLLLANGIQAQKRGYELSKKQNEHYNISSSDKLIINNRFGQVKVNTWAKNELTVDIIITAWGRNEELAQTLLNKISIDHKRREGEISFKTNISKNSNNNRAGFEINYEVNMPENCPLDLDNRFGAIYLANHSGQLDLVSAYGSLTAKRLMGDDVAIKVSYGKASIEEINSGSIKSSYCSFVELGKAGKLIIDDRNGKLEIDEAEELDVESAYSHFKLGKLTKMLELESKFGGVEIGNVANSFNKIDIEVSYGSLSVELDDALDFTFDVEVSFGSFHADMPNIEVRKQAEGYTSAQYEGYRGKGGRSSVTIESSYGSVRFN
ncbi:MAG: DUF4097 family beta strand repeat-containing protein [Bacteroidota bacterium]